MLRLDLLNGNPVGGQPVDTYGYAPSGSNGTDCNIYRTTVVSFVPEPLRASD
jgi:hypothetical protein